MHENSQVHQSPKDQDEWCGSLQRVIEKHDLEFIKNCFFIIIIFIVSILLNILVEKWYATDQKWQHLCRKLTKSLQFSSEYLPISAENRLLQTSSSLTS